MTIRSLIIALLTTAACGIKLPSPPKPEQHVAEANAFTQRYASSRFAAWRIHATARGGDCDVLFIETAVIMEDSMVEAIHYGAGAYGVVEGGVQRFSRDRSFRGIAYKDSSGRIWTYGNITARDAEVLEPCH
jgi:hypothetical protein